MSVNLNNTEYETYNVTAGLHVSTLTESSSGPHDTDPYKECTMHSLYGSVSWGPEDDSVRVETCNPAVTLYVSYSVLLCLTYFIHCIQQIVSFLIPCDRRTCSPHGMGITKSTVTIYWICCVLGTNWGPVCYTGSYRIWRKCLVYCSKCRQYQTSTGRPYRLVRVAVGKG